MSCGSPTAFTGLWFHSHLAGSAQTVTHLSSKGKCSFPAPVNSSNRVYLEAHSHLPAQLPATGTCLEGTLIPRDVPVSPSTPHPGKWQVGFGMPQQDSCWQSCSHGHHICAVLCYTCMVLNAPRRDIPGNTTGHCACRYEHFTGSGGACSRATVFGVCQ